MRRLLIKAHMGHKVAQGLHTNIWVRVRVRVTVRARGFLVPILWVKSGVEFRGLGAG